MPGVNAPNVAGAPSVSESTVGTVPPAWVPLATASTLPAPADGAAVDTKSLQLLSVSAPLVSRIRLLPAPPVVLPGANAGQPPSTSAGVTQTPVVVLLVV